MKKIIANKVYDTDTAKLIGLIGADVPNNDYSYWEDKLYQKRTGEFFLFSRSLHLGKYGYLEGRITPLPYEAAQQWVKDNLDADIYTEIFGDPEQNDTKVQLCVYLRKDTTERIKRAAAKAGLSVYEYVETLVK